MPELLESNKIFYTPYEPKLKNRYIMEIGGISAFVIKTAQRPQITFDEVELEHMNITKYVKGKGKWQTQQITLYDPIVPSAAAEVIVNLDTSATPDVPDAFNPIGRRGIASSSATALDAVPLISRALLAYFILNASCSVVIATLTSLPRK